MSQRETPTEIFKRALANAARSLAEQPDLEVVFSGDGPSLSGHRAVLPHPPRELSGPETTRIRGLADQLALRVAHRADGRHPRPDGPRAPDRRAAAALGPRAGGRVPRSDRSQGRSRSRPADRE